MCVREREREIERERRIVKRIERDDGGLLSTIISMTGTINPTDTRWETH